MILYFGNELSKHGFTPTTVETLSYKLKEKYLVVSASSVKNPIFRLLHMIWIFIINIRKSKLILIDTYSTKAFYFSLLICWLARLFSKPYCPILHGGDLPKRLLNSPGLSHFVFNNSYENISPSLYLKKIFHDFGYKVKYIPNYIDLENYKYKIRTNCKPKLLWVRSFHASYNPEMAIRVLHGLLSKYPKAELCMVGPEKDGSLKYCKKLAEKLNIKKHIFFAGLLPKEEWIELSSEYDIFINTTNFDNIPVSVIEAMALGFPIISTNVGGLKYLHEHMRDALLIDKNDVRAMISCIDDLLNSQGISKMLSENAREKAINFGWNVVKKDWEKLLLV